MESRSNLSGRSTVLSFARRAGDITLKSQWNHRGAIWCEGRPRQLRAMRCSWTVGRRSPIMRGSREGWRRRAFTDGFT